MSRLVFRSKSRKWIHRAACNAFTLPEVLIAAVVLALAVIAVTQAVVAGQMQTHDALHRACHSFGRGDA